ncbi:MAG: tmoS 2 [Gemmataceae bacterium]|nr:tmoS 2 [Gemmataceae bacterium]
MRLSLFVKGLILLSVPTAAQLAFLGLAFQIQRDQARAQQWAGHSKEVIAQAQQILADSADASAGVRGYAATRDPSFTAPFDTVSRVLPGHLDRLEALVEDNPEQTARAGGVRSKAMDLLAWQAEVVGELKAGAHGRVIERLRAREGEERMNALRAELRAFLQEEEGLDRVRAEELEASRRRVDWLLVGGCAASFLLAGLLAFVFRRGISGRFAALVENTRRLAAGRDLSPPLPGGDEIAGLDRAFRDMAAALVRATDQIRESARQVQDLYDFAPCGYHSVDADGTVVAMNQTELRWLGYPAGQVVGRMRFADMVSPASLGTYWATFTRVKEHGAATDVELEVVRRDGTTFPILLNSSALRDPAGKYVRSRSTLTDLTERKRADGAVRQSEERYRTLVNGVRDYAIFMLDPDGRVTSWNEGAQRTNGYAADEIIGRHFSAFYPPGDVAAGKTENELRAAAADGRYEEEGWRVRKDGSMFWAGVVITALQADDGTLRGFAKITRDLTERKRAEDEVRRLNDELEQRVRDRTAELAEANRALAARNDENELFVYSVSHDLRSPLVNLQGFSQELGAICRELRGLVDRDGIPPAVRDRATGLLDRDAAEALHFIQAGVLRLGGIIDALLRLSRVGRVDYQCRWVDVGATVGRVVESLQGTIAGKGAAVAVAELPPAWGDPAAVEQVFANLIGNALNYLDPARPGRVEVGTAAPPGDGGGATFFVRDNGLGIPAAYRHKVFQAFQRVHPEVAAGEGMGLAIVRRVVDRHLGRIWVESDPGTGSTFFVTLPPPAGDPPPRPGDTGPRRSST